MVVAATGAGWALAVDAASYLAGAALIWRMRSLQAVSGRSGMLSELGTGWREFVARRWVWAIVVQFSLLNMAFVASLSVYVPVLAQRSYGGPAAYGLITAADGIGALGAGVLLVRLRPARPLLTATLGALAVIPMMALLAAGTALWPVVIAALVSGAGFETFGVLWASALQLHIPPDRLARVSAYDALGSFALMPLGLAAAGPTATALGGIRTALWAATALMAVPTFAVLAIRDVRTLRQPDAPAPVT